MTRIAVQQLAPVIGDLDANAELSVAALREAAAAGADVVVLPELVTSGYLFDSAEECAAAAIPADDAVLRAWADEAARAGMVVVGGFCEAGDDGNTYNSAVIIDETGAERAVYRKLHLWDGEKRLFTPGAAAPPVVSTRVGNVAVVICYDLEFPELTRGVAHARRRPARRADQLAARPAPGRRAPTGSRHRHGDGPHQPHGHRHRRPPRHRTRPRMDRRLHRSSAPTAGWPPSNPPSA